MIKLFNKYSNLYIPPILKPEIEGNPCSIIRENTPSQNCLKSFNLRL